MALNAVLAFIGGQATNAASGATNPVMLMAQYTGNQNMPVVLADEGQLTAAFLTNNLDARTYEQYMLWHGKRIVGANEALRYVTLEDGVAVIDEENNNRNFNINTTALKAARYYPTIDEAHALRNRGLINEPLYSTILQAQTGRNGALATVFKQMRYEIPGPSDLVRFAVRDCFTPEIVETFEYAKETPVAIKPWMEKQGYGQTVGIPMPSNATDTENNFLAGLPTWFDLYWWSHWELPAPTQGYEMLHKLYPDSRFGPSPLFNGRNGFTDNQMSLLLKAQDYPSFWRDRLIAISYHTLNRSDVMPMYEKGLVNRQTVYHALRCDGYNDENAMHLLALADYNKAKFVGIDVSKQTKQWVCTYYSQGMITRPEAIQRLKDIGVTEEYSLPFLNDCDESEQFKIYQEWIKTLRTGFIRGVISEDDLRDKLPTIIKNEKRIQAYINLWTIQRNSRYKQLSAGKNLQAYTRGLIDRNEIIARLQNLQYTDKAISTMINLADYDINQRRLKMLQQQLMQENKLAKERIKAQQQAQKEAAKQAKKRVNNLEKFNNRRIHQIIKASSDKNILEWYKKELIQLWEVFYRLYYKDLNTSDAMKWVKNKLPDIPEEELRNAEIKASKVYRSEPNPPLV